MSQREEMIRKPFDIDEVMRRLREAVRLVYDHIAPGWDLVFVVRSPAIATAEFQHVQAIVEQLLRRAGIWREPPAALDAEKG